MRGLLESHVTLRHVNVKGHFAFVELQDTPRYAQHRTTSTAHAQPAVAFDVPTTVYPSKWKQLGPCGRITLLFRFVRSRVHVV